MNSLEILADVLWVTSRRSEYSAWSEKGFADVCCGEPREELLESRGKPIVGFVGTCPDLIAEEEREDVKFE